MKPETISFFAPVAITTGMYVYGVLILGVHPLLAGIIAASFGFAYDWLDQKLP